MRFVLPELNLLQVFNISFKCLTCLLDASSLPRTFLQSSGICVVFIMKTGVADLICVVLSRGRTEEAAGRDQCGLSAAGTGKRAEQEDRPGAEDE